MVKGNERLQLFLKREQVFVFEYMINSNRKESNRVACCSPDLILQMRLMRERAIEYFMLSKP
jgi:hypothetical protein